MTETRRIFLRTTILSMILLVLIYGLTYQVFAEENAPLTTEDSAAEPPASDTLSEALELTEPTPEADTSSEEFNTDSNESLPAAEVESGGGGGGSPEREEEEHRGRMYPDLPPGVVDSGVPVSPDQEDTQSFRMSVLLGLGSISGVACGYLFLRRL